MSRVSELVEKYQKHIALPWLKSLAPQQRVLFLVYEPAEELKLRLLLDSFEASTKAVGHGWKLIDVENAFADWMSQQDYKSVGLPESYAQAKFVLWLRSQDKESVVRASVEAQGGDWAKELRNLNVSTKIHKALYEALPETFPSTKECASILIKTFPAEKSVSDTDFELVLKESLAVDGKIPLTMIVMDEVQQYIGNNDDRVASVQSAVQACSKAMDGRIMLVATGQSALSGTTML